MNEPTHSTSSGWSAGRNYSDVNNALYKARRQISDQKARNGRLEDELRAARREVVALNRVLDSTSYRLGKLITAAARSPRLLLRLPADLWALRTEAARRRRTDKPA